MTNRKQQGLTAAKPSRRDFLQYSAVGLGNIALSYLLAQDAARAGTLAPKPPHHPAKAKSCIFLLMEGGPSHIDTFDPKPMLEQLHMTGFAKERSKFAANMNMGERYYVRSPFEFRRAGQLGIEINSLLENFAGVVDDVCFYRGLQAESVNHPTALYHLNTGNQFGGDQPSALGRPMAWAPRTRTCRPSSSYLTPQCRRADPPTGAADFCRLSIRAHPSDQPACPSST